MHIAKQQGVHIRANQHQQCRHEHVQSEHQPESKSATIGARYNHQHASASKSG